MKIEKLRYQRNGVAGEPFYHAFIEDLPDIKGRFLATFRTNEQDTEIDRHSCRVVSLDKPNESWRGDNIADQIQVKINFGLEAERQRRGNRVLTIYDLITL